MHILNYEKESVFDFCGNFSGGVLSGFRVLQQGQNPHRVKQYFADDFGVLCR